jgi:hypothetical protein
LGGVTYDEAQTETNAPDALQVMVIVGGQNDDSDDSGNNGTLD